MGSKGSGCWRSQYYQWHQNQRLFSLPYLSNRQNTFCYFHTHWNSYNLSTCTNDHLFLLLSLSFWCADCVSLSTDVDWLSVDSVTAKIIVRWNPVHLSVKKKTNTSGFVFEIGITNLVVFVYAFKSKGYSINKPITMKMCMIISLN